MLVAFLWQGNTVTRINFIENVQNLAKFKKIIQVSRNKSSIPDPRTMKMLNDTNSIFDFN